MNIYPQIIFGSCVIPMLFHVHEYCAPDKHWLPTCMCISSTLPTSQWNLYVTPLTEILYELFQREQRREYLQQLLSK